MKSLTAASCAAFGSVQLVLTFASRMALTMYACTRLTNASYSSAAHGSSGQAPTSVW